MTGPAATLASLLLEQLEMKGPPKLNIVAERLGLRIREVDSVGFDGALVCDRDAGKGIIAVKATMVESTRKRFTIAHEIGHFIIPTHRGLENICGSKEVESWHKGLKPAELEANEFAAELLLPTGLLRDRFKLSEPSFERITHAARDFDTSLTATTRRYIDLTGLACAIVWSQHGKACWYHRSDSFPFYLTLTDLPTSTSFAGKLFERRAVPSDFNPVAPDAWLSTLDAQQVDLLFEHSLFLQNYNAVLTMLWLKNPPQQDEDAELLEDLDPLEFTLARKKWPGRR